MRKTIAAIAAALLAVSAAGAASKPLTLTRSDYEDRIAGAWIGQIIGTLMGFQFEGKVASSPRVWVDRYPMKLDAAPVDDDYYYELVALRAFEKYGINMTLDQLGQEWKDDDAGSWGSSEQTRLALARGIPGSQAGHPRNNRLWWTIGPQFSADLYGMLAPGDVNLAGSLARKYGHINGYAEAVDGAVFVAGMVSLAFRETDPHTIVREAAKLIDPSSPYRQCLDLVISMAERSEPVQTVFQAVENRWHIEYPPVNNAVANGGLVAASVWYGEGDYLKTVNLAYRAADYSDADCNAANAGAVIGAMRGSKGLPMQLVERLNDRIAGSRMGPVHFRTPVDERISAIVHRIAAIGRKVLAAHGALADDGGVQVPWRAPVTQRPERFLLSDFTAYWDAAWQLERAGFGFGGGPCARGTYLDGAVLVTWPRDEARGALLRRTVQLGTAPKLDLDVAADGGCGWSLEVVVDNTNVLGRVIGGGAESGSKRWQHLEADLSSFAGRQVDIRIYQRTLLPDMNGGSAYWHSIRLH